GIEKNSVTLWGTGEPLREFLWSEDMADASVFVMENVDFKDTYPKDCKDVRNCHINIGTGNEISIRNLAALIAQTMEYAGNTVFDAGKPNGTMRKLTDVSKLNALGWKYTVDIQDGVKRLNEWYLQSLWN
ncbi:MAG: NAD-dependent epimerase/dehydratase family protein, partial [Prevotellaceae bacterium]|nr:NAD-dependent epimerase/dehydratase family protein [Prevotellaceae bacterium]